MFENSLIVVNIKLDNARWFLRGLNKPFDPFAQKAMHDTMIGIANCTEAVWAYHIGNEIVLYLNPNAISRCKTMILVRIPSVQRYNGEKQSRDCCQTERHISSVGMKAKSLPYLISFVSQNIF